MLQDKYPALWHFVGAYLHQDWRDEYSDEFDALADFLANEPRLTPILAVEIDQLLGSVATSQGAEQLLCDLGSFYIPSREGKDASDWLSEVRDRIDAGDSE